MLNLLELALNNNYIYIGIISVLVIIIIITILSINKDRRKAHESIKEVEPVLDEAKLEEQKKAKLELEKVVEDMQKNIDETKTVNDDIKTYEEEQEEHAIISYQELVEAVKGHENQPHKEVGMEVADTTFIDEDGSFLKPEDTAVEFTKLPKEEKMDEPKYEEVKSFEPRYEETKESRPYEEKNFKTSEVISPIYGRGQALDEEEDEFLDSLKDFRKNL